KKIREKFNRYLDVVNRNKQVVEASYTAHLTSPLTAIQDCCFIPATMMEFDGNFNTNVSKTICCDRLSPTVSSRAFNPGRDLNSDSYVHGASLPGSVNVKLAVGGKRIFLVPVGYSTMSPQEDSENPPGNNDPLSAGVDVGNHDDDLDLDTPPQTAALLSHKFHPYRHTHTHHHPLHTHHLQAAVTVHSVDAEC
ncbi:unnamed protein product, partial [Tetraodon nigroviridis]